MMDMLKNIALHKASNPKLCFMLMSLIHRLNINSLEELKNYEDNNFIFPPSKTKINDEEIAQMLFDSFINDVNHYDYLSIEDESNLKDYYDEYIKTNDIDEKFILLIKIYVVLDWGVKLPYHAYNYLIAGKL